MPKVATHVDALAVLTALATQPVDTGADDVDRRILDAAGHLLVDVGLEDLEVDQVAELAGVGRSTIYRRFDGRNALLAATVAHEARRLLAALADAVAGIDDPEEQLVVAFSTGLRVARATGLAERVRDEPLLLRLITVDGGPVLAAASSQLAGYARALDPSVDERESRATAELLVRLAISLILTPQTALDLDEGCEDTVRRHLAPLIRRR
ncbi:TetR family transcriptional regulator [Acidimicrobiia bacterium EGI L10123]|uniref:TetR family transcriptional regulator n=1 Tax=Salinilacustrithrix flava TaxID=2957203 RepID=UPI003D7C1D89|nr:TetR family transcriptional regulator [Acidimicrobiia bacterium EGI L10123]